MSQPVIKRIPLRSIARIPYSTDFRLFLKSPNKEIEEKEKEKKKKKSHTCKIIALPCIKQYQKSLQINAQKISARLKHF